MNSHPAPAAWVWAAAVLALACLMGACSSRSPGSAWNVEGPIRAIDDRVWIVGDRLVTIAPDARIVGSPAVGSVAQVRGTRNEHGSPIGESVEITTPPQATMPPTVTSASLPTAPPTATNAPPPTAPPQVPVIAPQPAPPARPAVQPKPQAEPDRDEDEDDDKKDKEEKERRGPPAKPGGEQKPAGKPRGR